MVFGYNIGSKQAIILKVLREQEADRLNDASTNGS